jgi:hypothetical protein
MSSASSQATLVRIEQFFAGLEERARQATTTRDFVPDFVRDLVNLTGAAGGQLWQLSESTPVLDVEISVAATHREWAQSALARDVVRAVDRTATTGQPVVLYPGQSGGEGGTSNGSPFVWCLAPIATPGEVAAVLVLMVDPVADPVALERLTELIGSACELATDFFTRQRIRNLANEQAFQTGLVAAAARFHAAEGTDATALEIAVAARDLLACDRTLIVLQAGRRVQLLAASGVEAVDRRSELAGHIARMVKAISAAGHPAGEWAWRAGEAVSGAEAPEITAARIAYVDQAHSRALRLIPLATTPEARSAGTAQQNNFSGGERSRQQLGWLVCEWFQGTDEGWRAARGESLAEHAAGSLRNALDWDRAPVARALRGLRRSLSVRTWSRTAWGVAVLAGLAVALATIPAELRIEARGELRPSRRTELFAPRDGIVREVSVDTGSAVQAGDRLLILTNEQLDLDVQRVEGELETALRQRTAIETSRLENRPDDRDAPVRSGRLTAELEQVDVRIRSLETQRDILSAQRTSLELKASAAGEVLTWNARTLLDHRPIRRGQKLLTIADLTGPWELALAIPDHRSGHVHRALQQANGPLVTDFVLANEPGHSWRGELTLVGTSAEIRALGERPSLEGIVPLSPEIGGERRPGVSVTAKIHCGRRALGYVWFHELWDLAYRLVWF